MNYDYVLQGILDILRVRSCESILIYWTFKANFEDAFTCSDPKHVQDATQYVVVNHGTSVSDTMVIFLLSFSRFPSSSEIPGTHLFYGFPPFSEKEEPLREMRDNVNVECFQYCYGSTNCYARGCYHILLESNPPWFFTTGIANIGRGKYLRFRLSFFLTFFYHYDNRDVFEKLTKVGVISLIWTIKVYKVFQSIWFRFWFNFDSDWIEISSNTFQLSNQFWFKCNLAECNQIWLYWIRIEWKSESNRLDSNTL